MAGHTSPVHRARRHQRLSAGLALGLLALVAELAGRSLTHRIDVGRHVGRVSYADDTYYPFLLAAVKVAVALLAARIAWRFAKAIAASRRAGASPTRGARIPLEQGLEILEEARLALLHAHEREAVRRVEIRDTGLDARGCDLARNVVRDVHHGQRGESRGNRIGNLDARHARATSLGSLK